MPCLRSSSTGSLRMRPRSDAHVQPLLPAEYRSGSGSDPRLELARNQRAFRTWAYVKPVLATICRRVNAGSCARRSRTGARAPLMSSPSGPAVYMHPQEKVSSPTLPRPRRQTLGHSVTRYGLRQPKGLTAPPYFIGLATGSGRPSFQLTRSATCPQSSSTFLNSPERRHRQAERLDDIGTEVVVAVFETNGPTCARAISTPPPRYQPSNRCPKKNVGWYLRRYRSSCARCSRWRSRQ